MKSFRSKHQRGLSVLESTAVLFALLTIGIAAFGTADFVYMRMQLAQLVDKFAFDQGIRSFRVNQSGELVFNRQAVQDALLVIRDELESDAIMQLRADPSQIFFEVDYARIEIDSRNGKMLSLTRDPESALSGGSLSVPGEVLSTMNLDAEFARLAGEVGQVSALAVPTPLFRGTSGQGQYLPGAVLLGVRAVYSFEGSLTAWAAKFLGFSSSPVVYDYKVVAVRGEVQTKL